MTCAPTTPDTTEELFAGLEQRCPHCHTKLVPLIDTELALVWACDSPEHAWPLVFWGGADGEQGMRNAAWIVRALLTQPR